ncbi:cytochrome b-c1 complex subunit 9-like [Orussus abietinus]|uniref:cytochrome b-c1 complex subunit 9-like n=1 Tax=Orussus abietinus TaxID=222816 RepID=UPI000C71618B|nr:cytochrome b-c1 complex subunit 9-like [Orussus abietinus]
MAARAFYQYISRRTSTFTLAIVVGSMFFERFYDHMCEAIFEKYNEGRLWMHIKDNYESSGEKERKAKKKIKSELKAKKMDTSEMGEIGQLEEDD